MLPDECIYRAHLRLQVQGLLRQQPVLQVHDGCRVLWLAFEGLEGLDSLRQVLRSLLEAAQELGRIASIREQYPPQARIFDTSHQRQTFDHPCRIICGQEDREVNLEAIRERLQLHSLAAFHREQVGHEHIALHV